MNASELRAEIARAGKTYGDCAGAIGISAASFGRKMSLASEFKGSEIKSLVSYLGLDMDSVNRIFFSESVT